MHAPNQFSHLTTTSLTKAPWRNIAAIFGIGQKRCKNCLNPFFPSSTHDQQATTDLCEDCLTKFAPAIFNRCSLCGNMLQREVGTHETKICPACQTERPPWDHIAFHGLYKDELRDMLLSLKFGGDLHLASLFADWLLEASNCLPRPDILTAVPMYPPHLASRGFNQAHEICKQLSRKSVFPFSDKLLYRTKMKKAQEELDAAERKMNLRDSFLAVPTMVKSQKIWLIDDIMTTGSTLRECCRQLKNAGANEISILFVARTVVI